MLHGLQHIWVLDDDSDSNYSKQEGTRTLLTTNAPSKLLHTRLSLYRISAGMSCACAMRLDRSSGVVSKQSSMFMAFVISERMRDRSSA